MRGDGFMLEPSSGSCLKVLEQQADYAAMDQLCSDQGGRLATIASPQLNAFATQMLQSAGAQYAWIGLRDVDGVEGNPVHSDGM